MTQIKSGLIINGRYRVVKQLSDRSYRVWDSALEQPRLLTFVSTGKTSNRPILLAQLHHANLPRVTDVLVIDNEQALITDYVAGQTITERIEERGVPVDLQRATYWIKQIGSALDYMHTEGITHGGVSASNIEITAANNGMLTNFGTEAVDPVDDIRSLALAYMVMLTGDTTLNADNAAASPLSSSISAELLETIQAGLNRVYPTVGDFLGALNAAGPFSEPISPASQAVSPDATTLLPSTASEQPIQTSGQGVKKPSQPIASVGNKSTPVGKPVENSTVYLGEGENFAPIAHPQKQSKQIEKSSSGVPWGILIGSLVGLVVIGLVGFVAFSVLGGDAEEGDEEIVVNTEQEESRTESNSQNETADVEEIPTAIPLSGSDDDVVVNSGAPINTGARSFRELYTYTIGEDDIIAPTFSSLAYDDVNKFLYFVTRLDGVSILREDATVDNLEIEEILGGPAERVVSIDPTRIAVFTARAARGVVIDITVSQIRGNFNPPSQEGYSDYRITSVGKKSSSEIYMFGTAVSSLGDNVHFAASYNPDSGALINDIILTSSNSNIFTVDQQGFIYAASNRGIQKFNPEGMLVTEFGEGALKKAHPNEFGTATPEAFVIAPDGSVVIATRDGGVIIIDQVGELIATYGTPLSYECFDALTIELSSICEPDAITLNADGSKIFYTDRSTNYSSISVIEVEQ